MHMYSLSCLQYIPEKIYTVQTVSELISLFVHGALYNVALIFTVLVEYVITSESFFHILVHKIQSVDTLF